jgi:hypothetical protein
MDYARNYQDPEAPASGERLVIEAAREVEGFTESKE